MVGYLCYFRLGLHHCWLLWVGLSMGALTSRISFLSAPSYQLIISRVPALTHRATLLETLQVPVWISQNMLVCDSCVFPSLPRMVLGFTYCSGIIIKSPFTLKRISVWIRNDIILSPNLFLRHDYN